MKRLAIALLASFAVSASVAHGQPLVVNEIDYDQVGTDTAEFVEIKNNGMAVNLNGIVVEFVNGSGGAVYKTVALPAVVLAGGDYFVICANTGTVSNCDLDETPDTDLIQNGTPDAVRIVNTVTMLTLDALSYEGSTAGATEGTGASATDSNTVPFIGVSRFPDGADTNDNNTDASLRCITPGTANTSAAMGCQAVATEPTVWGSFKTLYR